ncbi:MFS transporter [Streptomyces sp. NPDC015242]|uniref:MFS transporter n=1 Tax=Streptomyces sp. NPDC015242 TaxID=3364951 RepID=UPI0036F66EC3
MDWRFRSLVVAHAVSAYGTYLNLIALSLFSYEVTGTALGVGAVMAVRLLSGVAAGLAAGAVTARVTRRGLMVATDVAQTLAMAVLALGARDVSLGVLLGAVLVLGAGNTLFNVALRSAVPVMVGQEDRARANGVLVTARSVATVLGFASAAPVIALGGFGVAFAVNGASFAVSAAAVLVLRPRTDSEAGRSSEAGTGAGRSSEAGTGAGRPSRVANNPATLTDGSADAVANQATGADGSANAAGNPATGADGSANAAGNPATGAVGSAGTAGNPVTPADGSADTAGHPASEADRPVDPATEAGRSAAGGRRAGREVRGGRLGRRVAGIAGPLLGLIALRGLDALASASHNVALPLAASAAEPSEPALFMTRFWSAWAVGTLLAHQVLKRRPHGTTWGERAFAAGTCAMSLCFVAAFTGPPAPALIAAALAAGFADGWTEIVYTSRLQAAPDRQRDRLFGLSATAEQSGFALGTIAAAAALETLPALAVVGAFHGVAACGALALLFTVRKRHARKATNRSCTTAEEGEDTHGASTGAGRLPGS